MCNIAKQCTVCGRTLTLDNFRKVYLAQDGHSSTCKECARQRRADKKEHEIIKGGGNPDLANFTPRELIEELRARGYKGTLEYTKTITL
jgi:organic radical activating enzyme